MKFNKDSFEMIFFARGGQGAKTATELLAQAAVKEGKFVKAFPFFGPERSGAPTKMFLRVSDNEIRTQEPIVDPDVVVVMDDTVIGNQDVTANLDKKESLIVNTKKNTDQIREMVPTFEGKIHCVDATKIALDVIGKPNYNAVVLGKVLKVTNIVSMDSLVEVFNEKFLLKIGKELTDKNIVAMEKGHDYV